jgi:hypothetical protein
VGQQEVARAQAMRAFGDMMRAYSPAIGNAVLDVAANTQTRILRQRYGVQLTTQDPNVSWSNDQVNTAFQATVQNAQMYNDIAQQQLGMTVRNPFALFRQINGPVEYRYHNQDALRLGDSGLCTDADASRTSGGATTLYGLTCTPTNRGLYTPTSVPGGAASWGQLQDQLQGGASLNGPVVPTVVHLTNTAFTGGVTRSGLVFGPGFIISHELGHIPQENWNYTPVQSLNAEYVGRSQSIFPNEQYPLFPGTSPIGSRSSLEPDEYLADAIANVSTGTFDQTDTNQEIRYQIVQRLIADLIAAKGFQPS